MSGGKRASSPGKTKPVVQGKSGTIAKEEAATTDKVAKKRDGKLVAKSDKADQSIDDLFRTIKRTKPEPQTTKDAPQLTEEDLALMDTKGTRSTKRRVTQEGYPIYTPDELGITQEAGNTPECPFDCSCCF